MNNRIAFILLFVFAIACTPKVSTEEFDAMLKEKDLTVLMFFAPDCPLCITFSKPVNELCKAYPNVKFIAVQSGDHYTKDEIDEYMNETYLLAEMYHDKNYAVAHRFNATVTPEFVLLNKDAKVLYQGLLDDRMKTLGVYKQHWDQHYLKQAIEAATQSEEIKTAETTAIGCVLEY